MWRAIKCLSHILFAAGLVWAAWGAYLVWEASHGQELAKQTWTADQLARDPTLNSAVEPGGKAPEVLPSSAIEPRGKAPKVLPPAPGITSHPDRVIARLVIPRLHSERFVLAGASDANLKQGPAWITETVPPGTQGNCVITGHRDTHFAFLKSVQVGDAILLDNRWSRYSYRVDELYIVSDKDLAPYRTEQTAVLTLVTCYPFSYVGQAPRRFVVRARLIDEGLRTQAHSKADSPF